MAQRRRPLPRLCMCGGGACWLWRALESCGSLSPFLVKDVGKDTEKWTSSSTLQPCNKYKSGRRRQHGAKSERRREGRVTNHVLANPCTRAGSLSCSRSFRTVDTTVWCVFFFTRRRSGPGSECAPGERCTMMENWVADSKRGPLPNSDICLEMRI